MNYFNNNDLNIFIKTYSYEKDTETIVMSAFCSKCNRDDAIIMRFI